MMEHLFVSMIVMVEEAERLHETVTGLLELDAACLPDAELHELVVAIQRERARLGAAAATLVAQWERRAIWRKDGSLSAAARLARETRTSRGSSGLELRRARQSHTMPATMAAIADGRLSLDHLDLLGRANQPWCEAKFAAAEQDLVDKCAGLRYPQAVKVIDYWLQHADATRTEEEAERRLHEVDAHVSETLDKKVRVDADLDPIGGAIFKAEFDRLERELYLADQRNGVERSNAERRAAALIEMATRSATMPANGRRPQPLFTVLIGDDTLRRICELSNGIVIAPGQLVPYLDTALLESILFDGPSTIISASYRRNFTGAVRRAVEVRDCHCQHPAGCDTPAERCDVDHIIPVADGGITSQFDGRIECPPHNRNRTKHDHGATPQPERTLTRLDELRARIRWRIRHRGYDRSYDADQDDEDLKDTG